MQNLALFTGSSIATYFGLSMYGEARILKLFLRNSNDAQLAKSYEETRKFEQFDHSMSNFLESSKISFDDKERKVRYLYMPTSRCQGFPGVSHGGFTYSQCLVAAEEFSKRYKGGRKFKSVSLKYTAPIKVDNTYVIEASESSNGDLKMEIVDLNQKKYSFFTGVY